jgi:type VI secretion system protein ImpK
MQPVIDGNEPRWQPEDDDDKTVVVPTPGGRRPAPPPMPDLGDAGPVPPPPPDYGGGYEPPPRFEPQGRGPAVPGTGINPLVAVASPLLTLIATLQKTERLADPMGLRARIEQQMRGLAANTQQARATPETLKAASYCLCTAIDEAVLRTPWGAGSDWRKYSLLRKLHGDAWGGEKFFEILGARMRDPGPNIDLLELLYICLALGFQGKYAMLDDGEAKRQQVTDNLYDVIRRQRGDIEHDLSPHWQNEEEARVTLEHPLPIWVVGAVAAAVLLSTYVGFRFFLADTAAPTLDALAAVGRQAPSPVIEPPPSEEREAVVVVDSSTGREIVVVPAERSVKPIVPPPPPPAVDVAGELEGFLEPEIREGLVTVLETGTQITVRITAPEGRSLFALGSARVSPPFDQVIERIRVGVARYQEDIPGDIIVVGHTDNIPIRRSLRFQDNYDLSLARAASVVELLSEGAEPRITKTIEKAGKGASEPVDGTDPVAGNRTAAQRAQNRRVEILIEK